MQQDLCKNIFFMYKIPPFAADSSKAVNKIFEEFYKNIKSN